MLPQIPRGTLKMSVLEHEINFTATGRKFQWQHEKIINEDSCV